MLTMNNIKFVKEVRRRPCLYNNSDASYGFKYEMNKAWDEIGKKVGLTGAACKEKWRNLRIAFQRHLKLYAIGKQPKPYYLLEHMKFLTPYLKGQNIPLDDATNTSEDCADTGNTSEEVHLEDPLQSQITIVECKTENDSDSEINDKREEYEVAVVDKEETSNLKEDISYINEDKLHAKRKKMNDDEMELCMKDILKRKSSEFQLSNDPIKSFLDSLEPELREMNTQQFKTFKRKVLVLIDSIMEDKSNVTIDKDD